MAKKATTLHDNLGNDLLPVTNASITFMDNGNSVQAEINDLKEKTQYNKGHYTTEQDLLTAYPNNIENPQSRKGWYVIVGSTDTMWIWDIEGNEWKDSGVSSGGVDSVNGLDGEVVLTGSNINATATIDTTSTTKSINGHLNDIYSELENTVDLTSPQTITGLKTLKSDHNYYDAPPSMLELNNNYLSNDRRLGLSTTENFNLYLTSYLPNSEDYRYISELSLEGQYLLFGRLDGQTFSDVNGIKFENNNLYKMYFDYINQSVDQKRILTESDLSDLVDLSNTQTITGLKIFTDTIGLANTSEGTVDQIKHINNNFLITSGTGQNLLNIDEGLETISAFNRQLAYEDEIAQIQGDYATKSELNTAIQDVTDMIPTNVSELTNDSNYATEQYVQQNGGKIDTISVNGVQQTITNKNVDISVPTDYVTNQQLTDGLNSKQNNLTNSQLQAVNSGANTTNINQITTNSNNINTINSKIPNQASSTNQLADKDFVNSSLNSITAFYITSTADGDPFATKSALTSATTYYSGGQVATPTRNDYAIVLQDETKDNATTRYIYYNQWEYQYTVNETALTADQLSAINSGITSTLVGKISSNELMINSLAEQVVNDYVPETRTINNKPLSNNITLNASDVGALPDTTTIPTVNNGTLTIQKNGTSVGTFTANQSSSSTINITVPTGAAADKGVVTSIDTSANLPTSNAVKTFVEGKGYITSSGSITGNAATATKATQDGSGNVITTTYAKTSDLTNYLPISGGTVTGPVSFTGTVGNTQTTSGVYLGLDTNTGAENANMAIVSSNTASYIDMGRPNVDYDFRIIKWNGANDNNAQFSYGGNASGTITIPQKTGTIALTSDIPTNTNQLTNGAGYITSSSLGTQATFSLSGTTLTITPK